MGNLHDRLAVALREAREASGLSQRALAKKLHTNQTRICLTETGDQHVRLTDFVEWCNATGIDPVETMRKAMEP